MDQMLHGVATTDREEIKGTTKQKVARWHNKEGRDHLEQESIRLKGGSTYSFEWVTASQQVFFLLLPLLLLPLLPTMAT